VFLGESGFALVPIYRLFEEFAFYVIGFPIARWYGTESPEREAIAARLKRVVTDAFTIVPAIGLLVGFLLNRSGLPRPVFYEMVNAVCIPLAIFFLLTSIGVAMRFTTIWYYLKECLAVSAIKFMLVPAALTLTASLLGFGRIQEGLPLKVVLIVSSMPVAFTALVPPSLYDLDLDLANACWLFTTALLGIMVPTLFLVINLM
jgi:predicted permease